MLRMGFRGHRNRSDSGSGKSPDHPLFRNHAKGNHESDRQLSEDPVLVEINKSQVALNSIEQFYYDIPTGRKNDALGLLLHFIMHHPARWCSVTPKRWWTT